jgi:hypothetical protein
MNSAWAVAPARLLVPLNIPKAKISFQLWGKSQPQKEEFMWSAALTLKFQFRLPAASVKMRHVLRFAQQRLFPRTKLPVL